MRNPQHGDTVYAVLEHLYYPDPGKTAFVAKEYTVCEGEIKCIFEYENSRHSDARVLFQGPEPHRTTLRQPRLSDFGKKVFYDRADAVALAERMTDDYERRWAWTGETLRRPWRKEQQI